MNIHDSRSWFKNIDVLDYFNGDYKQEKFETNTIGNFRIPSRVKRLNFERQALDKNKLRELITKLANVSINVIINSPEARPIKQIMFGWLLDFTRFELRQAVCEMIQNMILNNQVYEVANTSGVQSPTFTISKNITGWLLSSDPIGTYCKNNITKSGIFNYEVLDQDEYFSKDPNSSTMIIGRIPLKVMKELKI